MYDRQFFVVFWGPVSSASAQLPALLVLANRASLKLHRSSLPNLKRERSERERCDPEEIGTYPGKAGVASLVEVRELDNPVWAVLAAIRPLGVLSVLLGWSPGLGAGVIGAGVFA